MANKVSVIIPNYNHADYLKARIDSVLNQSFQDFEIILLDDASTDNSADIIKHYSVDPRFHIFLNKINSGSTLRQWNLGIEKAQGDYIWIAESDDLADPEFLERFVTVLDSNGSIVLAYCQSKTIDREGTITGSMKWWTDGLDAKKWESDYINNGHDERKHYLAIKNTIPNASAVLFRRRAFLEIKTKEDMKLCGDWLIWSRLMQKGNVFYCAQQMNYFRCHKNNVRSSITKSMYLKEFFDVSNEIISSETYSSAERKELAKRLYKFWSGLFRYQKMTDLVGFYLILARFSKLKTLSLFGIIFISSITRKLISYIPDSLVRFIKMVNHSSINRRSVF